MSFHASIVDGQLRRAEWRVKRLRLVGRTALLGSVECLVFLALAGLMWRGWMPNRALAGGLMVLALLAGFVAWLILAVVVATNAPERRALAAAMEQDRPRLLDRINTLVALGGVRRPGPLGAYLKQVEQQAEAVLLAEPPRGAFSPWPAVGQVALFIGLITLTTWFYDRFDPWSRIASAPSEAALEKAHGPPEVALPPADLAEGRKNWGEVRISDPGQDLRVTKVDVVPLQIEAAANDTLTNVGWFSAVNGAAESPHALPAPTQPQFAVYQPLLYLDEFQLADWDVLTYYARAETKSAQRYASDLYFVEVRPFREDLLKLPGGESGRACQTLGELTELIKRQQHVLRETHQHVQQPPADAAGAVADRRKLAAAETDLASATRHLYAHLASEAENEPIGSVLDDLALAEHELDQAADRLDAAFVPEGQQHERTALAELVATRKAFQKAVSEHPDAFAPPQDNEPKPVAETSGKLQQMVEFRNESAAAQRFVNELQDKEQRLAKKAASRPGREAKSDLADSQAQVAKSFQEFRELHPQPFNHVPTESRQAQQALGDAEKALRTNAPLPAAAPATATKALERLQDALHNDALGRQLTDAYRLKGLLDQQSGQLGRLQEKPDALPRAQRQQLSQDIKQTLDQLGRAAEEEPTRQAFGPPLREALGKDKRPVIDSRLAQLGNAADADQTRAAAGQAKESVEHVRQAFDQSQPPVVQDVREKNPLREQPEDLLGRGLSQLESLLRQLEAGRPLSPEDAAKQRREAVQNVREAVGQEKGRNEPTDQLLVLLQRALDEKEKGEPFDAGAIKKLLEEIRRFSVEVRDKKENKDRPALTHIDPARFPPAYRQRIARYFQKLSEP